MEPKDIHKSYQRYNSEEIELNTELFSVIRKRNIPTQEKLQGVQKLLESNPKPDINAQDGNDNWNTALHLAIKRNELEVVTFLLTQGADTAIKNGEEKTPLNLAEERNNVEIIDALRSFTSQVESRLSDTDKLPSNKPHPVPANSNEVPVINDKSHEPEADKQAASTVLPPFSKKLKVDKKLKLSHKDFKQTIKEFHDKKELSAIEQLIAPPPCPTPYVLAHFAKIAYSDCKPEEPVEQLQATPPYPTPNLLAQFSSLAYCDCKIGDPKPLEGWKFLTTASHFGIGNGYFGTAYWHPEHQQVVIAHRGTDTNSFIAFLKDLYSDIKGVVRNKYDDQMNSASTFANNVVAVLQEIQQEKKASFEVFFTGHSLGGWLAQITNFTTEYLEVKGGTFLKKQKTEQDKLPASSTVQDSHDVTHSYHPHTVAFDSPGCENMLLQLKKTFDVRHHGSSIDLRHLDITSYLSAPNRINTCNSHLGTVCRIFTNLSDMGWKEKHSPLYNLATHKMDKIMEAFDPETGQVFKDDKGEPKIRKVVDWPVSAGLTGEAEWENFFKWAEHLNNYHPEVMDTVLIDVPKGYHTLRYQTNAYDGCTV